jgi:hypothetical protein
VASLAGAAVTVQDCGGADRAWIFAAGESLSAGAALSGITIRNGRAAGGGALLFVSAAAAVRDCVLEGALSDDATARYPSVKGTAGGAAYLYSASPLFERVTFRCAFRLQLPMPGAR